MPSMKDTGGAEFAIGDARAYITEVRWKFAKTMPQWPHEYTVRGWRADCEELFAFLAGAPSQNVVTGPAVPFSPGQGARRAVR